MEIDDSVKPMDNSISLTANDPFTIVQEDQNTFKVMYKWISIKDRLPDVGEWVLIYTPVKEEYLIEIAMLDALNGFINPAMGYGSFKNVTHWMPLPEAPR